MIAGVVVEEDLRRNALPDDRLQLLQILHDAAVASQANYPLGSGWHRMPGTDRGGQVIAHRSSAGVGIEPLALLELCALHRDHSGGGVGHHYDLVPLERFEQFFREAIGIHDPLRFPIFREDGGIAPSALHGPIDVSAMGRRRLISVERAVQGRNEGP